MVPKHTFSLSATGLTVGNTVRSHIIGYSLAIAFRTAKARALHRRGEEEGLCFKFATELFLQKDLFRIILIKVALLRTLLAPINTFKRDLSS